MQLFKDRATLLQAASQLLTQNATFAALIIGSGKEPAGTVIHLPAQPNLVAEQLYSALHKLDELKVDQLLVELPPDTPEWAAVHDRLSRAGYQG